MERVFEHRTRSYKACVMMLVVTTLVTMAGYSTSHWVDRGYHGHYGLWLECSSGQQQHLVCHRHDGASPVDDILRVPQILITLELAALVISCIVAIVVNCRHYIPGPRQRYLELLICSAGLLGTIGTSVFWAQKDKLDTTNSVVSILSWSFFLVFLGSLVSVVLACAISCNSDAIPESNELTITVLTCEVPEMRISKDPPVAGY